MRYGPDRRPLSEKIRGRIKGSVGLEVDGGHGKLLEGKLFTAIYTVRPGLANRKRFIRQVYHLGLDHEIVEYRSEVQSYDDRRPWMVGKGRKARQLRDKNGELVWKYVGATYHDVPSAYRVIARAQDADGLIRLGTDKSVLSVHREIDVNIPRGESPRSWSAGGGELTERAKREMKIHPLYGPAVLPRPERQADKVRNWLKSQKVKARERFANREEYDREMEMDRIHRQNQVFVLMCLTLFGQ